MRPVRSVANLGPPASAANTTHDWDCAGMWWWDDGQVIAAVTIMLAEPFVTLVPSPCNIS